MRDFGSCGRQWRKKAIAVVWWGKQSEAELQTEIAEREAEASRVVVVSWQRW
jgi:hypothetical protein